MEHTKMNIIYVNNQAKIPLHSHYIIFAVASQQYNEAENEKPIQFNTSCDLMLLSTSQGGTKRWNGDVFFFSDTTEILIIGFHPESSTLAIKNEVFKEGSEKWGWQWIAANYPARDQNYRREYTVNFNDKGRVLTVTCKGKVSLTTEFITCPFRFLNAQRLLLTGKYSKVEQFQYHN
jgi:hypothetical protein